MEYFKYQRARFAR
ncbi:hypothetical protein MXB_3760 [Myxobolus squamalis]|nr:hypothetical protein MXB_455 [Myxobolus squamalis]KAF1740285.1 hypothetical protein MXB_3760 [Myxobolus squamalis]